MPPDPPRGQGPLFNAFCSMPFVQCHGQVGKTFQALKRQNKEVAADLEGKNRAIEELNSDAQELADLVKSK